MRLPLLVFNALKFLKLLLFLEFTFALDRHFGLEQLLLLVQFFVESQGLLVLLQLGESLLVVFYAHVDQVYDLLLRLALQLTLLP